MAVFSSSVRHDWGWSEAESRSYFLGRKLPRRLVRSLTLARQHMSLLWAMHGKRTCDVLVSLLVLLLFSPFFLTISVLLLLQGAVLSRTVKIGRWRQPFAAYSFVASDRRFGRVLRTTRLHRLPLLFNVLKGDMSLIGPRAASPHEFPARARTSARRFDVRPGLICLWWLRQRANVAYDPESEVDLEYVDTYNVRGDCGIALRALPALFYGRTQGSAPPSRLTLLGVPIHNMTMGDAIAAILSRLARPVAQAVFFVNSHCANIAQRDAEYGEILRRADLVFADGIGMKLAGKILGQEIRQNVNGTDLFPRLCEALSGTGQGIFFLGGSPGVAEKVRDWVAQHYPDVVISGWEHGYFSADEEPAIVRKIAASGASLLLVALGVPQQEKWIARNLASTGVSVAMGVGGLFDFYSGRIPRAPLWLREIGGEWAYRLYQEPGRMWKRYVVGNAVFLGRALAVRARADRRICVDEGRLS